MPPKRAAAPSDPENAENEINMHLEDSADPSTPKRRRIEGSSPNSSLPKSSPMSILYPTPPRKGRPVKGKFSFTPKLPALFEMVESPATPTQNQASGSSITPSISTQTQTNTPNYTPAQKAAEKLAQAAEEKRTAKEVEAARLMSMVSRSVKDGGFGFLSLGDFLDTFLKSKEPHLSCLR